MKCTPLTASPEPPPDRQPFVATPTWGRRPGRPAAYEAVNVPSISAPGKAFYSGPSHTASPVNREDHAVPKTAAVLNSKDAMGTPCGVTALHGSAPDAMGLPHRAPWNLCPVRVWPDSRPR